MTRADLVRLMRDGLANPPADWNGTVGEPARALTDGDILRLLNEAMDARGNGPEAAVDRIIVGEVVRRWGAGRLHG